LSIIIGDLAAKAKYLLYVSIGIKEERLMMCAVSAMRVVGPVGSMRRSVGPGLNHQEILVQIGLMGQVQAFLADVEHLILGAVNCCHVNFNGHGLLLHIAQRTLHMITLASVLMLTVISVSSPSAVEVMLNPQEIEHPANKHIHQILQGSWS
jgi:hypothetical protein